MTFGRRTVVALLASITTLAFLFRYPQTPHEMGTDSFVIHGLVQVLLDRQRAAWIINPLSFFGLYPLSYPSGPIFSLFSLSSLSNTSVEASVFLSDMVTAAIGSVGAFVMAREIDDDPRFALLVSFLFSLAPHFISSTTLQVPTRSLLTALIPWFIWGILVLRRNPGAPRVVTLVSIVFLMLSAHRLVVLMAVIVVAYVVAALLLAVLRLVRTAYGGTMLQRSTARALRVGSWALVALFAVYFLAFSGVLEDYQAGQLTSGQSLLGELQNLAVSMMRNNGLLLPVAAFGIVAVVHARNKDIREPWLIAILLGLLPTLSLRQYVGAYTPPFAAIFVALGLLWILRRLRERPRLRTAVIVGTVVLVVASSALLVRYDLGLIPHMSPGVYDGGIYIRQETPGTFASNSGLLGAQVNAVSGVAYLPIGGATTAYQGPEILAFGYIDPANMRVQLIPLDSLTVEDDSVFALEDVNLEKVWAVLLSTPVDQAAAQTTLHTYGISLYLEDSSLRQQFTAFGGTYYSSFGASVSSQRYLVYASGALLIYEV